MDFFARQERSRRTSRQLIAVFLLAFLIVSLATTAVVAASIRIYMQDNTPILGTQSLRGWVEAHGLLLLGIAAGTLGAMALASGYRAASLARGGGQVARMLGATEVTGEETDPLRRRLRNVVEEMALASGLPVPDVFVLEKEPGINAFAAGLSHGDAAIAVTRGALERLDRAELQGVVAHEFSHILNGDMRINQQLIGLSFGILVLSLAGRWLLRSARYGRRGRNNGGIAAALALGAALAVIGWIGVLLSRLIKAGVSRQRELLADASAVQFTREPSGLAGALKKIGGYTGRLSSVDAEEVAHMLFECGARAFSGWFATHPPLLTRIRALDPAFDPKDYPPDTGPLPSPSATAAVELQPLAEVTGAEPKAILERMGQSESASVGGALRASLPTELCQAARARESSFLLILAMALAPDGEIRHRQFALLENQLGPDRASLCRRLHADLASLDAQLRLPLLELALPAVKQRPREQLEYLFDLIGRLAAIDAEQTLFDYVLLRVLAAYLRGLHGAPVRGLDSGTKMSSRAALSAVLSTIAAYGHTSADAARAAYRAGFAQVSSQYEPPEVAFDPPEAARDLKKLDGALEQLARLRPDDKRRVVNALLATIEHDGRLETDEIELFRAIAATLDCPVAPAVA